MTHNNLIEHESEQIEALRRDFEEWWKSNAQTIAAVDPSMNEHSMKMIAWCAFLGVHTVMRGKAKCPECPYL